MALLTPCLDCGRPSRGPRCAEHRRERDRERRPAPAARGHGAGYRAARAELIGLPCALRLPGCTEVSTTADYIIPVSRGGRLSDGLQPACAHCNSSRGNRLMEEIR